uniref:Fc receptor like A n=2 Tax=Canis lupus familiaris TaxID=9615 RepID=A0A8C0RQ98_CANLF
MLKKISVLEAAGDLNTVTMRLGCVLTAGVLYFSPTVLWAAQMLLGPSSSTSSRTLNPAPQKSPVPESTPTAFPGPQPPLSTPSKNPGFSSPLQVPDPHLYHQMGILLKQMQDMRALLGHLVMELRDLSVRLKLETIKGPVEY